MRHYILTILIIILTSIELKAQKNEYMYFAIRVGVSNAFSSQPTKDPQRYIYAPAEKDVVLPEMQLQPAPSFLGYVPGAKVSLLYHFDFAGDVSGIFTGVDYNFTGISSKFETLDKQFSIVETYRMHMIGVPLALKYGADIWDTQRYLYAGGQINYIASMFTMESVSWGESKGRELEPTEFNKTVFSFFVGFNWKILNVQFDFYPKSVFNQNYEIQTEYKFPSVDKKGAKKVVLHPNEGQVDKFFKLSVSVNLPYGWLSERSFKMRRMLLKFPWK